MKKIIKSIRLFLLMTSANLNGLMSYKVDFLVSFFAGFLSQTIGIVFLGVLFQNISSAASWNVYEVATLYGFMYFGEGIFTLFFQGTNGMARKASVGIYDQYMTRPISVELQIYGEQTNLAGSGTAITGLIVIFYSFHKIGGRWSVGAVAVFLISLIMGAAIRVNINFSANLVTMIMENAYGFSHAVGKVQEMGKYPLEIYPLAFQYILLTIIPYAAVSYVPASVLLGKREGIFWLYLPFAFVLSIWLRRLLFNKALEKYEGSGS